MSTPDQYIQDAIEVALASARASGSKPVAYFLELALYEHKEATVINQLKSNNTNLEKTEPTKVDD